MKIFEKEIIDEVECEICKCNTKTELKNKIVKWPKNLIFSINRYTADFKLNSEFDYTRHIELFITGKINKYTLCGIINHIGTKELGHYTYVKVSNDSCVEINDDKVKQIVNFKSPMNYILIYNLVN
jgi:ubiquitin C-terminal hydrolase